MAAIPPGSFKQRRRTRKVPVAVNPIALKSPLVFALFRTSGWDTHWNLFNLIPFTSVASRSKPHGTPPQLEGLSQIVVGLLSRGTLSGHVDQPTRALQHHQSRNRQPHPD